MIVSFPDPKKVLSKKSYFETLPELSYYGFQQSQLSGRAREWSGPIATCIKRSLSSSHRPAVSSDNVSEEGDFNRANQLYSPEVIRAAQDIATLQKQIESQLVSNQAFVDAVSQYQELAETVQALHRRGVLSAHSFSSSEDPELGPEDPYSPSASIYDQTVDPHEPLRNDVYEIQSLLAQYLLAATVDQGELSESLSETEKKQIRFGLATMVGFAAALPIGLIFGYVAIPVGVGAGAWSSREFDEYYDIKKRQQLPEDESDN
jgi:hypothetical protein